MAATCLPHSRVSLVSLFGPGRPVRNILHAGCSRWLSIPPWLARPARGAEKRSEEHTSELQSRLHLVCRLLLEKKKKKKQTNGTRNIMNITLQRQELRLIK